MKVCDINWIEISDLKAQNYVRRFSSQTSQSGYSGEIINPNILYREFYITFKYLKGVILNNKVQIKNYELYQLLLKIKKWRNDK